MAAAAQCGVPHQLEFVWKYGGDDVRVAGDWDRWECQRSLRRTELEPKGIHIVRASFPPIAKAYEYKFIVDGRWVYDPELPVENDNRMSFNNLLLVPPAFHRVVTFETSAQAFAVHVWGSWDNWRSPTSMEHAPGQPWRVQRSMPAGRYEYKFKINHEKWQHSGLAPTVDDGQGGLNNVVTVETVADPNDQGPLTKAARAGIGVPKTTP